VRLDRQNALLESILDVLSNPARTASAEYFRRGVHAYQNSWDDDALRELDKAIEIDRYVSVAHLYRGLVLHRMSMDKESLESLLLAVKYSVNELPVCASAAITIWGQGHGTDGALTDVLLTDIRARLMGCPEYLLVDAIACRDQARLAQAIEIAPELGIDAHLLCGEWADQVTSELVADDTSNVGRAISVDRLIGQCDAFSRIGFGLANQDANARVQLPQHLNHAGKVVSEAESISRTIEDLARRMHDWHAGRDNLVSEAAKLDNDVAWEEEWYALLRRRLALVKVDRKAMKNVLNSWAPTVTEYFKVSPEEGWSIVSKAGGGYPDGGSPVLTDEGIYINMIHGTWGDEAYRTVKSVGVKIGVGEGDALGHTLSSQVEMSRRRPRRDRYSWVTSDPESVQKYISSLRKQRDDVKNKLNDVDTPAGCSESVFAELRPEVERCLGALIDVRRGMVSPLAL